MSHKDRVMLFHPPTFSSDTPPTGLFDKILIFCYCMKSQLTKLEANIPLYLGDSIIALIDKVNFSLTGETFFFLEKH